MLSGVVSESITYVGHATVLLDLAGARLLTDPVLRDRIVHLRRRAPAVEPAAHERLDGVLISHLHYDHLDLASLRRLPRELTLVVPRGGAKYVRRLGFAQVLEAAAGETVRVAGVDVLAVPAEHDGRRRPGATFAEALGYVVTGDARVYFAGDTDLFDEMAELGPCDVALLPVAGYGPSAGPGHLDPESAARALTLLRPGVAVPIHWGTLLPMGMRDDHPHLAEPPREFAGHAAQLAPDVRVEILEPGESLALSAP
jgi:L-ascorbate metabolism protein UlaG (beta-lactamase superfamily)